MKNLIFRKSLCFAIALAMIFSLFIGIVPVSGATTEGIYTINDFNTDGTFEVPDDDGDGLPGRWFKPGWEGNNIIPSVATDEYYSGSKSLKLETLNDNNGQIIFGWVGIQDTKQYRIKFRAKILEGILTMKMYEVNSDWSPFTPDPDITAYFAAEGNEWKEYSYIYTPTPGAVNVDIYLADWSSGNLTAYIDDMTMEEYTPNPIIIFDQQDGAVVDNPNYTVSGRVTDMDDDFAGLTINGEPVTVTEGVFSITVTLNSGVNSFTAVATDSLGHTTTKTLTVMLQYGAAPVVTLDQGPVTVIVGEEQEPFTVSGSVYDENGDLAGYVTVNGVDVPLDEENRFSTTINLRAGTNIITVSASDSTMNTTEATIAAKLKLESEESEYDIGIYYFSVWNNELAPYMINNTRNLYGKDYDKPWFGGIKEHLLEPGLWAYGPIADREPLLGWYDDSRQEILDNHILQAASRGIDFFNFYYYWEWDGSGPRAGQNVYNYQNSPYKDLMDFMLCLIADGDFNETHWRNNYVPEVIKFIKDPQYKRTADGRPIVGFFGEWDKRLGGSGPDTPAKRAKIKENLDYFRAQCEAAGLGTPLLLVDGYRTLDKFIEEGYDGFAPLNLAGIGLDDNYGIPQDYDKSYPEAWVDFVYRDYSNDPRGYKNYEEFLFIPGGLNAFDHRPWYKTGYTGSNVEGYNYANPSPIRFKEQLKNVRDYLESHPRSMNMACFYAWNELGEGGTIEPTTLFGYGYLDAIQEVFNLNNKAYKRYVEEYDLEDMAPDVRMSVEPEFAYYAEDQQVKLRVSLKNYTGEAVTGTLSLSQPAANQDGIAQSAWNVVSPSVIDFSLEPNGTGYEEFIVDIGEGDYWTRHAFDVTIDYDGKSWTNSTFVVKAQPYHGYVEKNTNTYEGCKFGLDVVVRNYTFDPKEVEYTLVLPEGWTSNRAGNRGTISLAGYDRETGLHTNRRVKDQVVISYPVNTATGYYQIKLITTDGEFSKEETFKVMVDELYTMLYNGSFEFDTDDGSVTIPWQPGEGGGEITVLEGTEENPAPSGNRYVKVETGDGYGKGIRYEGSQGNVNWLQIQPSTRYIMTFKLKVESGEVAVFRHECQTSYDGVSKFNEDNSYFYSMAMPISAEENGNQWKSYRYVFTSEPDAGRVSLRFYGENSVYYLDSVKLWKVMPPVVTLDSGDQTVTGSSFTVTGSVLDENGDVAGVTIYTGTATDGIPVTVNADGTFSQEVLLQEGLNRIEVVAWMNRAKP